MNNPEMIRLLSDIKAFCDADKHGGALHFARTKMIELGFFDTMPETSLDPFRPAPSEWSAIQIAIFNNGEVAPPKRKRNYVERTKVQFGGNIKMWTRDEVNFSAKSQVSWQANFYLWERSIAVQVATELNKQGYVDQETIDLITQLVGMIDDDSKIAIPVLKTKEAGSRWMKQHALIVRFENGKPANTTFIGPDLQMTGDTWSEQDAGGKDLADNVAGQLRIGRHAGFDSWATQPAI